MTTQCVPKIWPPLPAISRANNKSEFSVVGGLLFDSVPPSDLALLLVLQTYAECSDAEAIERSACDLRWCAVLGKSRMDSVPAMLRVKDASNDRV